MKIFIFVLLCMFVISGLVEGQKKSNKSTGKLPKTRYLLNKPECTEKNFNRIEAIIARAAVIGPHGRKFPEDLKQLKSFCKDTNRMMAQVETFAKSCFERSIRDFSSVIIYTIKSNVRKYCQGKSKRKMVRELIKLGPCANKYVQPHDECLRKLIDKTSKLVNVKNDKIKIPYSCCYYQDMIHCVEDFLGAIPCIRTQVPTLMEYYRTNAASLTDMTCGDYTDATDACERLGPVPKAPENRRHYLTPFSLAFDMLDGMQNFTAPVLH